MVKNACFNVTSLSVLFCLANSPKPKYIQFNVICDEENCQILIFEEMEM